MVLTDSSEIYSLSKQVINHGRSEHSVHTILGYNYRLTNICAAIGLVQLSRMEEWNKKRRDNARYISENLKDLKFLKVPKMIDGYEPVFHQYTLRVDSKVRKSFMEHLVKNEVGCGVYYPLAVYNQPLYQSMGFKKRLCPNAEKAAEEVLSIPVHPALSKQDLEKIVSVIRNFK